MQPIRPVDRSLAAPSGGKQPLPDRSGRKSVNDLRAFYWAGPGWEAALKEARELVEAGSSLSSAAAHVGWVEKDLIEALKGEAHPVVDQKMVVKKRASRPLKNRVKGLAGISKKELRLRKQLYEIQKMTVREIAEARKAPYEGVYLGLIKMKTRFRRPGRRGSSQ